MSRPGNLRDLNFLVLSGFVLTLGSTPPPAVAQTAGPPAPPSPPGIRILSDITLPQAFDRAADIRWASDTSVFLSLGFDGAKEVSLDPAGAPPKEMIPGNSKPGGFPASRHLAASSQYLAVAGPTRAVAWRRLSDPGREEEPFDSIRGIDIQENRFAILGGRKGENGENADALAWVGTFDANLRDLRPILSAISGQGFNRGRCEKAEVGAVRFLPEGSLLIVPGGHEGARLYDGRGNMIRDWEAQALGVDPICGAPDDPPAQETLDPAPPHSWLNRWRTVDTVLPFPGGPALVVRRVEKGKTLWDLKVLKLDGTAETFALPLEGSGEFFHLKGDIRAGKIVFVLYEDGSNEGGPDRPAPARLIVAERAWPEMRMTNLPVRMPPMHMAPPGASVTAHADAGAPLALPSRSRPAIPSTRAALGVLSDVDLPPAFEWASDVCWASDESVYLGVAINGTFEVSLNPAGPPPKEMIPGRSKPGGFWASMQLAASPSYLVAAGPALVLTWRRIENPARVEAPFDHIQAIDLQGSRFAIVGAQRDQDGKGGYGSDGAIAWVGTLDQKLGDLRPLLYDVRGPGVPTMSRCGGTTLGAVRFLPDGSLVVIPGTQPGVNLYDSDGRLVRTWDSPALGIDADCGVLTDEQMRYFAGHNLERQLWLNLRTLVDTVLPFPQGPGLVVRRVEDGRARWELKLLRLDGPVETYSIPIEGSNEFFYLEGDLRAGKIVFLLHETVFNGRGKTHPIPPRLIVASPPEGWAK